MGDSIGVASDLTYFMKLDLSNPVLVYIHLDLDQLIGETSGVCSSLLETLYKPNHSLVLVHVAELPATLNEARTLRYFNLIKCDQSWRIWGRAEG